MLEIIDYSMRRGAIVKLLSPIYELLKENAEKDIMAALSPPSHVVLWKQEMRASLLVLENRWLFVLNGQELAGLFFYRFGGDSKSVFIHELQIAWPYRHNQAVFAMLLDKFLLDPAAAACTKVYAGERVKQEENKEILASVGFKEQYPDGWQLLGTPAEAAGALKLRYSRA